MLKRNFLFIALFLPLLAHAELTWDSKIVEHTADAEETRFETVFHFQNTGKEPGTITNVRSTCGCTTASLAKNTYAPGEKGSIKAIFDYGSRSGGQSKMITVTTDDKKSPVQQLALKVFIPQVLKVEGSPGEALEEKTLYIHSEYDTPIDITEVIPSDNRLFEYRLETLDTPNSFALHVTPSSEVPNSIGKKQILRGKFTLNSNFPTPRRGNLTIYALIK